MEDFKILDTDNNCLKSAAKCVVDNFEVSLAVKANDCVPSDDEECEVASLFSGELNCGYNDVVKET